MLLPATLSWSCNKQDEQKVIVSGTLNIEVTTRHHGWNVPGLSVYLASDALEFPGYDTTQYEWSYTGDSEGKTEFKNLFPGDYYLYSIGYDSIWGDSVIGYMPVRLSATGLVGNTKNVELYVSE